MAELYKRGQSQGSGGVNPPTTARTPPPAPAPNPGGTPPGQVANAILINEALMDYELLNGTPAANIEQLVTDGFLTSIPNPPAGMQWVINQEGTVDVVSSV